MPPPRVDSAQVSWPRITVVTPSYQQGGFLERTIRSVLAQGYPNLDYRVYDGGSTDDSVQIIRHYEQFLTHWESLPDRGQSHAINKGLSSAEGEIVGWLNSDDILLPNALDTIARHLSTSSGPRAIVGQGLGLFPDGQRTFVRGRYVNHLRLLSWWRPYEMPQPSIYWRRDLIDQVGLLADDEHLAMDYDLWVRISAAVGFATIPEVLAELTAHPGAKTADDFRAYRVAQARISRAAWGTKWSAQFWWLAGSRVSHLVLRPPARGMRAALRRLATRG
jgi:glycosyltransferase involved in cell wall biosynthesis